MNKYILFIFFSKIKLGYISRTITYKTVEYNGYSLAPK